jgi:Zn-dependent protease
MFDFFSMNPLSLIFRVTSVLLAITIHEFFHGLVADRLGDPTPRVNQRLSLNPMKHLDPIGTLALFFVGFGWAKPVPVDQYNLSNPKRDMAFISLAGPASNILTAALAAIVLQYILPIVPLSSTILLGLSTFLLSFIFLSVSLAVFNLLPLPPLDGSKILIAFLPRRLGYEVENMLEKYGMVLLLFLVFPLFGREPLISPIIIPPINFLLKLLLGQIYS